MPDRDKSTRARRLPAGPTELSFTSRAVEEFWSAIARTEYADANARLARTHNQRYTVTLPHLELSPQGKLLNLWSRQGGAIPLLRRRFPAPVMVHAEISRVMLRQSQQRFPGETFVAFDLQDLPLRDNCFDAILSLEMLEHSPSPQRICHEMHRVLRPGGQLLLTCPSAFSELPLWLADRWLGNHGEGPHRFPAIATVKKMLRRAGFVLLWHRPTLFVPAELGILHSLNELCEKLLRWFPASELGLRQVYAARKP